MRSNQNRYTRPIDPFAYSKEFGDWLAMADVEGRRRPNDAHDHLPAAYDSKPWEECVRRKFSTKRYRIGTKA